MNEEVQSLYKIRSPVANDFNFIMATFLRGLYYGDSWFSFIPKDIFMDNYKKIASAIVTGTNTRIKIACLNDDENTIIGYSVGSADGKTIHWVYVKSVWRKQGIGSSLVPKDIDTITHLSALGKSLMHKYKCQFNPFKLG